MKQTHEQPRRGLHLVRHAWMLRPLNRALGYRGHMLLCVSGSLLPLAAAQAGIACDGAGLHACIAAENVLLQAASTAVDQTFTDQTFTSTLNYTSVGANGEDANGQNYIPQPGESGASVTLQFNQSQGSSGNTVTTSGSGILISSIGGQGGAGYVYRGDDSLQGGPGAGGGIGGVIEISNNGKLTIATSGSQAHGIQATSQGGVGSAATDRSSGGGDKGGTGGSGKNVTVSLHEGAFISTSGQESNGILAQSLGNVAGDSNLTSQNTPSQPDPYPDGAVGGYGGDVAVQLDAGASVLTSGANANGIAAINRGGAGGKGASIVIVFGSGTAGNGGSGGDSGAISVISNGSITTKGKSSIGIVAQSSAGNGGYGGDASGGGDVTAGQAGSPGNVGDIAITHGGSLTTSGAYSPGILGQSFAGSGGVGGSASGSLFYDQGGGASASTNGGAVNINLAGSITTRGGNSQAVVAQSIGGKGGMGGDAGGMIYTKGGDGGVGGSGGAVTVTAPVNSGLHINTRGLSAHGIVAQSVGGSGGMGGAANADGVNMASAIGGQAGAGGNGGSAQVNVMSNLSDPTPAVLTVGPGAFGILSQSIGGGGGAGGGAYTVSAGMLADVAFAVGGAGGDGGDGGNADATLNWFTLQTGSPSAPSPMLSADSIGVSVQSIGGGGGQGGSGAALAYAIDLPASSEDPGANATFSGAFSVGGSGGDGGAGGSATASVFYGSSVSTYGDGSLGVKIQSIGGGGGHGGDSSALAATIGYGLKNRYVKKINPQTNAVNISMAVGGLGGQGGNGGTASLIGLGDSNIETSPVTTVSTNGEEATAVLVQSLGGGGGNAGTGNAQVQSYATSQNLNLVMSVGATGGAGGSADTASALVDNTGRITTYGHGSKGLVVQSIGGGGGTGTGSSIDLTGLDAWVKAVAGAGAPDNPDDPNGGDGGNGGNPIQAALLHDRHITVGAQGGAGGHGGQATAQLNTSGVIRTYGVDAAGLVVQSIGGGGGLGGSAAAKAAAAGTGSGLQSARTTLGDNDTGVSVSVNSTISVGGGNGSSGSGGSVNVGAYGTISTAGDHSPGIMAQSVGAGGGRGALAASGLEVNGQLSNSLKSIAGALLLGNDINLGYTIDTNFQVGGLRLDFGDGGAVTTTLNGGSITTGQASQTGGRANNGFQSFGILAQSVGGGGGVAIDGTPGVQATATLGAASGLQLSLQGGQGMVNFGHGGAVALNAPNAANAAQIATYGDAAHGIFLQSVGGGGGVFGAGSSQMAAGGGEGRKVTVGLGFGSNQTVGGQESVTAYGGDGGAVSADFGTAAVTLNTVGQGAFGLLAQSIGGGGGTVAVAPGVATEVSYFGAGAGTDLGATLGSTSGDGGAVNVSVNNAASAITTAGVGAHGIMAQSVGGGGGLIGNYGSDTVPEVSGNLSTAMPAGGSGEGGAVNITASGSIQTGGAGAMAVLAQSIGGGGGWLANDGEVFAGSTSYQNPDSSTGNGGAITIDLNQARISATGENSAGVWAQSIGADGGGTITVNVGGDAGSSFIMGGPGQGSSVEGGGAGIVLVHGQDNQINISAGSIVQALSGVAVRTSHGSANITNSGSLIGNILSDAATSDDVSLNNYGVFSNADLVQGHVLNQGRMFIGKTADGDALKVTGDFTQGSRGVLHLATDFVARNTDLLAVGGRASLDGAVKVTASTLMPKRELTYLQAGALAFNAAMQGESDLFWYRSRPVGNSLALSVGAARFKEVSEAYGLGSNLHALGLHLQDIWDRGSKEDLGAMYAALNRVAGQGGANYMSALNDLSPGVLAAPAALKQAEMVSFANALMSCPSYDGDATRPGETECVWGRVLGNTTRMDGTGGTPGLTSEGVAYQMGVQRRIAPNWFAGVAGAYENKTVRSDERRQRLEGDTGYLGISLKYENGPWTFSGALTGSLGSFDNVRSAALMGVEARSDAHVTSFGQRLRGAYTHAMSRSYIKPFVDLDLIHTRMSSFDEHGAGALNLHVEGSSKWSVIVSPGIEVGGRFDLDNGYIVRPYASAGVSLSSTDKWDASARFVNAPVGTDPFKSTLETGRFFGHLSTGVQVLGKKGMDIRLQYDGLLSSQVRSHSGSLKASWQF